MDYNNTIYTLSTFYAKSALSIVRITGSSVLSILSKFKIKQKVLPRVASLTKIYGLNNEFIDECIFLYFRGLSSYTGLDLVELHLHGSIIIIKKVFTQLSLIKNFRLAKPGEFTKLALENNKISYDKAEAVLDLINSETDIQHKVVTRIYNGGLKKLQNIIKDKFISIISYLEAFIDFPDDVVLSINLINHEILNLIKLINKKISSFKLFSLLKTGVIIPIVGDTNSGKSTLMNILTKSERSIVSNIPGTTRDIVIDKIDILGIPVTFCDTAGIRYTDNTAESIGIRKAFYILIKARIIILVQDVTNCINNFLISNINKFNRTAYVLLIINKLDLIVVKDYFFVKDIISCNCNRFVGLLS